MLKKLAIIFGLAFVLSGILGFVPAALWNGDNLFGIFHVNAVHNLIHILTGLVSLWVGFTSNYASKLYFQIFGLVYGAVAILGFIYGERDILGLIASNTADIWLHLVIAVFYIYLGFGYNERKEVR